MWTVAGDVHLDEVERSLGRDLPSGDYETVAGLVIAEYGSLPEVGDTVEIDLPMDHGELAGDDEPPSRYLVATVRDIDNHVPSQVTLELGERSADEVAIEAAGTEQNR